METDPDALFRSGTNALAQARNDEAVSLFRRVLELQPTNAQAAAQLGVAHERAGDRDQAFEALQRAHYLDPQASRPIFALAEFCFRTGRFLQALESWQFAAGKYPQAKGVDYNIALALQRLGRTAESREAMDKALRADPENPEIQCALGTVLQQLGDPVGAAEAYRTALRLRPDFPVASSNLGRALRDQGDLEGAVTQYREALRQTPDYADANWNLALSLFLLGRIEEAWEHHEWRWQSTNFSTPKRVFDKPQWNGEPLDGATILVTQEQGFGDVVQFLRFVPLIAAAGGKVVVEVPPELRRLAQSVAGDAQVVVMGEAYPAFDWQVPLLSVPRAFRTSLATIPKDIPYLSASAADRQRWNGRLSGAAGLRVGLVWGGRPTHSNDRNRSLDPALLEPLLRTKGVRFFSLQVGRSVSQLPVPVTDLSGDLGDFADTAAAIEALDLLIAVDTSVVHVAGALGKPVWTLLPWAPDWRWMTDREDSPWYPSMRLFRQKSRGDWAGVIARVTTELVGEAALHGQRNAAAPGRVKAAMVVHQAGNHDEASALYQAILRDTPRDASVLHLLAQLEHRRGRIEDALAYVDRALLLRENVVDFQNMRGMMLLRLQRADDAIVTYQRSLQLDPHNEVAMFSLANALTMAERNDEALEAFYQVLARYPEHPDANSNLGVVAKKLGRTDDAIASYRRALEMNPTHTDAHFNLGNALRDSGDIEGALRHYALAIESNPLHATAHYNSAEVLRKAGRLAEADPMYRKALECDPKLVECWNNYGHMLEVMCRHAEALDCFDRALAELPEQADVHYNRALHLLLVGRHREGWAEHEWRWKAEGFTSPRIPVTRPIWDGTPAPNSTLLVHAEQGFGDSLQFIRYLAAARRKVGRLVVALQPQLVRMASTMEGPDQVVRLTDPWPAFDLQVSLLTLPHLLGQEAGAAPPYLKAEPELAAVWQAKLAGSGPAIGLVWAGNPAHANDKNRSMPLSVLRPLIANARARFFGLQMPPRAGDLTETDGFESVTDLSSELVGFWNTAAAISALDLIIVVDTAVAHLTGALGKPVWIAIPKSPDWRWGLEGGETHWYPEARIFRQPVVGDWESVAEEMRIALLERFG